MTLPRTAHRRKARKRARADKAAEARRWARLTPEQQARETERKRWLFQVNKDIARMWIEEFERQRPVREAFFRLYDE